MIRKQLLLTLLLSLVTLTTSALTPQPAPAQAEPIALSGAVIHVGNGKVIDGGTVTFEAGLITGVYAEVTRPAGHRHIDVAGAHIYPGFILPNTRLGLTEVNSVRATRDYWEEGELNPSVRSLIAFNTDSELIPTLRFNGVLTAQVTPGGGLLSGTSAIVQLDGWNWEDAAIEADDGMHLSWPQQFKRKVDYLRRTVEQEENESYQTDIKSLERMFGDAMVWSEDDRPNLKLSAVKRVIDGDAQLFIHVERAKEIADALSFAKTHDIPKVVLVGAREALKVKAKILEAEVPIIVQYVLGLPAASHLQVDDNFSRPARFLAAGFDIGLAARIRQAPASGRNLPFIAGTAAAYGISREQALELITLANARILGVDDELGSIEVGKRATLFVSQGDALDMRGNLPIAAFIDGRDIDLKGMQQELFERFHEKYANAGH